MIDVFTMKTVLIIRFTKLFLIFQKTCITFLNSYFQFQELTMKKCILKSKNITQMFESKIKKKISIECNKSYCIVRFFQLQSVPILIRICSVYIMRYYKYSEKSVKEKERISHSAPSVQTVK